MKGSTSLPPGYGFFYQPMWPEVMASLQIQKDPNDFTNPHTFAFAPAFVDFYQHSQPHYAYSTQLNYQIMTEFSQLPNGFLRISTTLIELHSHPHQEAIFCYLPKLMKVFNTVTGNIHEIPVIFYETSRTLQLKGISCPDPNFLYGPGICQNFNIVPVNPGSGYQTMQIPQQNGDDFKWNNQIGHANGDSGYEMQPKADSGISSSSGHSQGSCENFKLNMKSDLNQMAGDNGYEKKVSSIFHIISTY